jgi:hypothetical protein
VGKKISNILNKYIKNAHSDAVKQHYASGG